MTDKNIKQEILNTSIWFEKAEEDNPFSAAECFCAGYDVYGDLLANASWFEYLYLMFKLEKPHSWQVNMLEKIAIAISNPGIRDHSIRAAMNAGAGGSTSASALMAALAVGAGNLGGSREVHSCVLAWESCHHELGKWAEWFIPSKRDEVDSWPENEHPPGFDPNGVSCSTPVKQCLELLATYDEAKNIKWLSENRNELEEATGMPLAMTGVVSAAFSDIGFNPDESEMIFLLLRLPGAAAHSLEQKNLGYKQYPFFLDKLSVKKS